MGFLCRSIVAALSIPPDKPCNDACSQRIGDAANKEFSEAFMAQLDALKAAKIDVLLMATEAEANGRKRPRRMLTPVRLASERLRFVRGEHWTKYFTQMESDLRSGENSIARRSRATVEMGMKPQRRSRSPLRRAIPRRCGTASIRHVPG